jgi:inorganic phosphate transporter, PiT family
MVFTFIADLSTNTSILFIVCLLAVCLFEIINGFHDTANAVATAIYVKALPPQYAVVWSGFWNFMGAYFGSITVAMGIIKLVPLNDMLLLPISENVAMVLAILVTSIAWNLGTWYFGIPCSSSHTLIGSLIGAGLSFSIVHGGAGPNWDKAKEIGMSLLFSPLFGFGLAIGLMFIMRNIIKKKFFFKEPDKKKQTPLGIRLIFATTSALVSFFHGRNDGQKGFGLLIVILLAFMPSKFALNQEMSINDMKTSVVTIQNTLSQVDFGDNAEKNKPLIGKCANIVTLLDTFDVKNNKELLSVRKSLQGLKKELSTAMNESQSVDKNASAALVTSDHDARKTIKAQIAILEKTYEYRINWAILLISLCLGIGTMFGWKRIVVTIGEKIGKSDLSYAQGFSADICSAITIGLSSNFGLPVSTTQIFSSAIAGSMVAAGGVKNLQKKTIRNIALAWVLTLPVTFIASFLLFLLFRKFA